MLNDWQFQIQQNYIIIEIEAMSLVSGHLHETNSHNIRVFARIRPFNEREECSQSCIKSITDATVSIKDQDERQQLKFTFDSIFDCHSTQADVYQAVGSGIVASAFDGLNGTIFCYGQTSSGKTYTCLGPNFENEKQAGLLIRLVRETLNRMEKSPKNIEVKAKISMVEIYNQKIRDLLDLQKHDLKIRQNKKQGIFLESVTEKYILSEKDALDIFHFGIQNRSVGSTAMNSQSSRSHMVIFISVSIFYVYTGQAKASKIALVDLAGSEKILKTGVEGKSLEEAKKINTSLTTLGKVINTLADGKSTHIPYRDSKLTRLLQESLGGNSITNLIVNVSPSSYNQSETITTFRFGQRAKFIKNDPVVNRCYTVDELLKLLKKAEETIQKQTLIIKQLSCKKREGGYGTLGISSMLTMHFLPDDESVQKSLKSQSSIDMDKTFSLERGSLQQLKGQLSRSLSSSSLETKCRKGSGSLEKPKKMKIKKQQILSPSINKERIECKINKQDVKFEKLPSTIEEDNLENVHTPRRNEFQKQNRERVYDCSLKSQVAEHNLDKIRQNLFELKLRYLEERRENSIKTMIIDRKNKALANSKQCTQFVNIR